MQRRSRCLAATIAALTLIAPSTAPAQESGVTLDDGPSSKEYAIPLDTARGQTKTKAPRPKAQTPAPSPAATPAPTVTTTTPAKPGSKRSAAKPRKDEQAVAAPVTTTPDPPASAALRASQPTAASSDSGGAGFVIGGLALAVVALGALAGLVLRRRRGAGQLGA